MTGGRLRSRTRKLCLHVSIVCSRKRFGAAVVGTKLGEVICNSDGIGYGRGDLWVEVRIQGGVERYAITTINLRTQSPRSETGVRFVCRANDQRIVIDTSANGALRYRSWKRPRSVIERPDLELRTGGETIDGTGSCAHRAWSFTSSRAGRRSGCCLQKRS